MLIHAAATLWSPPLSFRDRRAQRAIFRTPTRTVSFAHPWVSPRLARLPSAYIPPMRTLIAAAAILFSAHAALAQVEQNTHEPKQVKVDAPIQSVTLYREGAMVTRTCALPDELGDFEFRIDGLPNMLDQSVVSARITGAKLLDVRIESKVTAADASTSPELRDAIAQLERAQRRMELVALHEAKLNDQHALINAIAQKTATESAKDFGSKSLDPAALSGQLAFIDDAREKLIDQRTMLDSEKRAASSEVTALTAKVASLGGKRFMERWAIVTVGKSARGAATLALSYLVGGASWDPDYAIRATDAGDDAIDTLSVEFDARVFQKTGEDWNDVALSFSTAEPTRRPAPPEIPSEFVDVRSPAQPMQFGGADKSRRPMGGAGGDAAPKEKAPSAGGDYGFTGGLGSGGGDAFGIAKDDADGAAEALSVRLAEEFADAGSEGGAVVNYTLPRKASVPSDSSRRAKVRIASIELKPNFSHVARPIVDPTVYLRASARNTSAYRLVEGRARIYVGEDSVGEAQFPTVPPGAEVEFWLGGDPRITAKRVLVSKDSKEQGVFGKDAVVTWSWRVDLTSAAAGSTRIELDDRMPVSRNEQIKVTLVDPSAPLSTDAKYLKNERLRGILRWDIDMPGVGKDGKPSEKSISWTVRRAHAVGVDVATDIVERAD